LTKTVIETALNEEMTERLGYEKNDPARRESGNIRKGTREKALRSDSARSTGIDMPRDRVGTFESVIAGELQRRLGEVDEVVLSLYAKGLTTGAISAHFAQIMAHQCQRKQFRGSPRW
jgi:putative transposase